MYYEVTCNGDRKETYLDVYEKRANIVIPDIDETGNSDNYAIYDPPSSYIAADLPMLDILHDSVGLGAEWRTSDRRKEIENS